MDIPPPPPLRERAPEDYRIQKPRCFKYATNHFSLKGWLAFPSLSIWQRILRRRRVIKPNLLSLHTLRLFGLFLSSYSAESSSSSMSSSGSSTLSHSTALTVLDINIVVVNSHINVRSTNNVVSPFFICRRGFNTRILGNKCCGWLFYTSSSLKPFATLFFQFPGRVTSSLARYFVFSPFWSHGTKASLATGRVLVGEVA